LEEKSFLPAKLHDLIKQYQDADETHNLLYCSIPQIAELGAHIKTLKHEVYYQHILKAPKVIEAEYFSEKLIRNLFQEFMTLTDLSSNDYKKNKLYGILPDHVQKRVAEYLKDHDSLQEKDLARIVSDYISGMTDRYAIYFWEKINGPQTLKIAS
jgi:dGTP triphosphohydrolase